MKPAARIVIFGILLSLFFSLFIKTSASEQENILQQLSQLEEQIKGLQAKLPAIEEFETKETAEIELKTKKMIVNRLLGTLQEALESSIRFYDKYSSDDGKKLRDETQKAFENFRALPIDEQIEKLKAMGPLTDDSWKSLGLTGSGDNLYNVFISTHNTNINRLANFYRLIEPYSADFRAFYPRFNIDQPLLNAFDAKKHFTLKSLHLSQVFDQALLKIEALKASITVREKTSSFQKEAANVLNQLDQIQTTLARSLAKGTNQIISPQLIHSITNAAPTKDLIQTNSIPPAPTNTVAPL